ARVPADELGGHPVGDGDDGRRPRRARRRLPRGGGRMSRTEPAPAPHEDALQAAARHAPALHSTSLRIPATHPPRRGVFISFEGGDGAGKSTQMRMLRDHLVTERSVAEDLILTTREPGGTPLGESIRELLLHGEHVEPRAEAL